MIIATNFDIAHLSGLRPVQRGSAILSVVQMNLVPRPPAQNGQAPFKSITTIVNSAHVNKMIANLQNSSNKSKNIGKN